MHLVVIPPGARAEPHIHRGYETGIYVLEGRVETRYGLQLESSVISEAGDFLFIPPGVPHEAINLSTTAPARAVVARNDPAEQDKVDPYQPSAPPHPPPDRFRPPRRGERALRGYRAAVSGPAAHLGRRCTTLSLACMRAQVDARPDGADAL